MKKIAIIGTAGVPANYGGFETLADNLVRHLSDQFEITVYCEKLDGDKKERKFNYEGAKLEYIPLKANGWQSIPYDMWSLLKALRKHDVLLVLGVSGALILPFIKLFSKKKVVVNVDGLEWRRDKWSPFIKMLLRFFEKLAVKYADEVIADNEIIQRYVELKYNKEANLIAYGGDHICDQLISYSKLLPSSFVNEGYAFKVARIEPENNVHMILKAFEGLKHRLVVVGNWDKSDYGRELKRDFSRFDNILLLDPIYDQIELDEIRSKATIYIHGHQAGGTNPSLVEAMNLGLPVLAFDCGFNRASTMNEAVYFKNVQELRSSLIDLSPADLKRLAIAMLLIAMREYSWQVIAKKYTNVMLSTAKRKPSYYLNTEFSFQEFEKRFIRA